MKIFKLKFLKITSLLVLVLTANLSNAQITGLENGRLLPCPDSPNCKVTEYPNNNKRYMNPLLYSEINTPQGETIERIKKVIEKMGGEIVTQTPTYLYATFTTFLFRFKDDFEVRLDEQNQLIHMRSASRTGYYDFGKNKRRIQEFTALLTGGMEY